MKIDFSKVTFDDFYGYYPLQARFSYEMTHDEIKEWLASEVSMDDVPEWTDIKRVDLQLNIYSRNDFELIAVCVDCLNDEYCVTLEERMDNAEEFTSLIPVYDTMEIDETPRDDES